MMDLAHLQTHECAAHGAPACMQQQQIPQPQAPKSNATDRCQQDGTQCTYGRIIQHPEGSDF